MGNRTIPSAQKGPVHQIAETGDRWFLALGHGVTRVGAWARREVAVAVDSAATAFDSARKSLDDPGQSGRTEVSRGRTMGPVPDWPRSPLASKDMILEGLLTRGGASEPNFDVVRATDARAERIEQASSLRPRMSAKNDEQPAGVLPLLHALRRVLADHTKSGGLTLGKDDRFWALLNLLESLVKRREAGATSDPERSPSPGSVAPGSRSEPHTARLDATVIYKRRQRMDR